MSCEMVDQSSWIDDKMRFDYQILSQVPPKTKTTGCMHLRQRPIGFLLTEHTLAVIHSGRRIHRVDGNYRGILGHAQSCNDQYETYQNYNEQAGCV